MGMMIYRENMTLDTDIIGFDLEATGGWTPDCNGKLDFDPVIIRGSARVYNDGDYICSIVCGDCDIVSTGIIGAGSVDAAKRAVEAWMNEWAKVIRGAVEQALKK
jgi:hypothetical protein